MCRLPLLDGLEELKQLVGRGRSGGLYLDCWPWNLNLDKQQKWMDGWRAVRPDPGSTVPLEVNVFESSGSVRALKSDDYFTVMSD